METIISLFVFIKPKRQIWWNKLVSQLPPNSVSKMQHNHIPSFLNMSTVKNPPQYFAGRGKIFQSTLFGGSTCLFNRAATKTAIHGRSQFKMECVRDSVDGERWRTKVHDVSRKFPKTILFYYHDSF